MNKLAKSMFHLVRAVLSPELNLSLLHLRSHGRWPNLRHPKTFNEKIQHRKLYDRNPLLPVLSDKLRVKDYVRQKLGDAWVTPTLWSGEKLPPRPERNWPIPYVIKANHGCKWNIFVYESNPDWDAIEESCDMWACTVQNPLLLEWAYSQIDRRILVEPFHRLSPDKFFEYKFFVFSGRVEYLYVIVNRSGIETIRFFDRNWVPQDVAYGLPIEQEEIPRPQHFAEMLAGAEALGSDISFVRVDLYDEDRPVFGEMTFYPCSGTVAFIPKSWDRKLGDLWGISDYQ